MRAGDGVCDGELRVGAPDRVHPVPEYESSSASADPRVGVTPPRDVVHGPPAVGRDVGTVNGDHLSNQGTGLDQHPREPTEHQLVRLLAEATPELGEEAVAGRPMSSEAAGLGEPPVSPKA